MLWDKGVQTQMQKAMLEQNAVLLFGTCTPHSTMGSFSKTAQVKTARDH